MSIKRIILNACLFTCLLSGAALADEIIVSTTVPPALREETPPPPRTGYEWVRGSWAWENGSYVWKSGYWLEHRAHSRWVSANWDQQDPQHWRYTPGHWETE